MDILEAIRDWIQAFLQALTWAGRLLTPQPVAPQQLRFLPVSLTSDSLDAAWVTPYISPIATVIRARQSAAVYAWINTAHLARISLAC